MSVRHGTAIVVAALSVVASRTVAAQRLGAPAHVRASIVTSPESVPAGGTADVWLVLDVEPGWHIGWRNPGETGLPTRIAWTWPSAVQVMHETWPRPLVQRGEVGTTQIITGRTGIRTTIRVSRTPAASALPLRAEVRLGVCKDVCIPTRVQAEAMLLLADAGAPAAPSSIAALASLRALLVEHGAPVTVVEQGRALCVRVPPALRGEALELVADSGTGYSGARRLGRADSRGMRRAEVTRDSGRVTGTSVLLLSATRAVEARAVGAAGTCR